MKLFLTAILTMLLDIIPGGDAFVRQLTPRDSILIADQLQYGVRINGAQPGETYTFPDMKALEEAGIVVLGDWYLDTLGVRKMPLRRSRKHAEAVQGPVDIEASIVIAPFVDGKFTSSPLAVVRQVDTLVDTLVFNPVEIDVCTMPVDTATFVINDIKGQVRYPLTPSEVMPWALGGWLFACLVTAIVCLIIIRRRREAGVEVRRDPAYIVALRKLDRYRGDKMWAPEKQKGFYSGVTDTLKEYIDERFGIDAPEMTTAELFDALKGRQELTPEMFSEMKEMFERADFVKFAKFAATDEENASTLPLAVRFVTSTWKFEEENESAGEDAVK